MCLDFEEGVEKLKMEELHAAESDGFHLKAGDLLLKKEGEYGNPKVKVYMISKLVFRPDQSPIIYGRQRLKDGISFHSTQTVLCFRADEVPTAIGHVDYWQQLAQATPQIHRGSWIKPAVARSPYLVYKPLPQMSNSAQR
ncbi:hypothetical protein ACPOL_6838 (plasmid) [Acidisarcina polymorpha]|uniref:Uncharacterized protein n=1 Tax=Acidisarcina polymorpha TaxID=2211140 RepID=A0A2Z5GAM1_9BACT|nr:hypothetical protein ACPOL_6838 [Acidisarcina polymorpha]